MLEKLSASRKKIPACPEKSSGLQLREECRALIAVVAGERDRFDTRELWLARAAERSGLSMRAIKALYYGEITSAGSASVKLLRDAAKRYEIEDIASRFEDLAARLRALLVTQR